MIDVAVLGSSPTALYAVRELSRAGFEVACADTARGCAMASRFLSASRRFVGEPAAVEEWLRSLRAGQSMPILLLPASDAFIEFTMQRFAAVDGFRVFDCYRSMAGELLDKSRFHALCTEHGVATPGIWHAHDRAGLSALGESVPYPCILKPALIHRAREFLRGKKVLLARSRDEFDAHVAAMPEGLGGWLVQEIVPGPESEITLFAGYVDHGGTPRQAFTARKLRQYPPGFGSASLVDSAACRETLESSLDFLRRIGFRGICGAEFKRDPRDGRLKFIEINPRPTLWFQIAHDAGMRVAAAAACDMLDRPVPAETPQREDVAWRYALKDAASARFYRRHGKGFVFPAPATATKSQVAVRSWPVFARDDARPAFVEPLGYLRKAWKRFA